MEQDRVGHSGRLSRWVDLSGPVHYLDFGGPVDGPIVVGVHGLAGSSLDWCALAPLVTDRCRLIAPDLAGHGLTESHGRRTTVRANRELLHRFIRAVPGPPVILMGNSMGGMLALLQAGEAPASVAGLVLIDAAYPFVPARADPLVVALFATYATPGLGRLLVRRRRAWPPELQVARILGLCCVDRARVPDEIVAEHVELVRRRREFVDVERDFLYAARSVVATAGLPGGREYRQAIRSIRVPVLLIHGQRDRLVPVAASHAIARRRPDWQLVILPDVGHVPQLEAPRQTAEAIVGWLERAGRVAARAADHPPAVAE